MDTLDIIYGVASQSLYFDCPEGRPSSVTSVAVYENRDGDDSTAEVATTGSASVETNPNTTFDAASGYGQSNPKVLNLTATTGCARGRRYLATAAAGNREWVETMEIDAGNSITARHPLHNAFAAADTLESTRISISVLDAWAATVANISGALHPTGRYRVRWEYVVDSVTYVADSYFDLVRYAGVTDITPLTVAEHIPGWFDTLPTDSRNDQGQGLIDIAYKQLKYRMIADSRADQLVRDSEVMGYLVALKADEIKAYGNARSTGNQEDYVLARDRFFTEYQSVLGPAPKLLESNDDSGAGAPPTRVGITVR